MSRFLFSALAIVLTLSAQTQRWTEQAAHDWYGKQPWLVGANYIPATAINELEMWQAKTFDPKRIDTELAWAESIGMNTMRVFLHDLPWQHDPTGFKKRIDTFLAIAAKHKIRPMLVLFDSCWDPYPKLGPQRPPKPGVHNSGWVQSPGLEALRDKSQYPRLEAYVTGVVSAFAKDKRVLAWDLWNEPDNPNTSSYGKLELPNKVALVEDLLPKTYAWARGEAFSTADERSMERRRLVKLRDVISRRKGPNRTFRRDLFPQLRGSGTIRTTHPLPSAIQPADSLHRVHGQREPKHIPGIVAGREEVQRGDDQLGVGGGKNPNISAVGLVAEALHGSRAVDLVP
jgi:hypothetical protein